MRIPLIRAMFIIFASAAGLVFVPGAPAQRQDSPAEAARLARAQKRSHVKRAKVLTNEDLEGAKPDRTSGTASAGSLPAGLTPGATKLPAEQGARGDRAAAKDDAEKLWRQRFAEAYKKLHLAEAELNVLDREWNKGQVEYYSDPQKALKEQYTRKDINEHKQKIEIKKKEIEQFRQAISDMETELRRAGGDAGWSREP